MIWHICSKSPVWDHWTFQPLEFFLHSNRENDLVFCQSRTKNWQAIKHLTSGLVKIDGSHSLSIVREKSLAPASFVVTKTKQSNPFRRINQGLGTIINVALYFGTSYVLISISIREAFNKDICSLSCRRVVWRLLQDIWSILSRSSIQHSVRIYRGYHRGHSDNHGAILLNDVQPST